jgi:hypothetical protein
VHRHSISDRASSRDARELISISGEMSWLPVRNPLHNHSLFFSRAGIEEIGAFVLTESSSGAVYSLLLEIVD